MDWVSVKDRIPESEKRVLAYCAKTKKMFVGFFWEGKYDKNWYLVGSKGRWYTATGVTHWAPLPEPPEGE